MMAYELTALIGASPAPPGAVALAQGALMPLCDESAHNAMELSTRSPVAYITAQFFGGTGTQAATLYRHGREDAKFETGYHAINAALHALGIKAEPPKRLRHLDARPVSQHGRLAPRYRAVVSALIGDHRARIEHPGLQCAIEHDGYDHEHD